MTNEAQAAYNAMASRAVSKSRARALGRARQANPQKALCELMTQAVLAEDRGEISAETREEMMQAAIIAYDARRSPHD